MSPPNAPGVPGMKLPPAAREERRPRPSNPPPDESVPPPAFRHRSRTLPGAPAPDSNPPPSDRMRDSREITTDSLLREYREQAEATRAAEARAHAAELALEASKLARQDAESGVTAVGPTMSLGSARWWVLVLGALCMVGTCAAPEVREYVHPAVTAAQLADVRSDIRDLGDKIAKRDAAVGTADANDAARWSIVMAYLCAQGLRARGLDCDAVQQTVEFQPQPLSGLNKVRAAPQWRTSSTWPAPRAPP